MEEGAERRDTVRTQDMMTDMGPGKMKWLTL